MNAVIEKALAKTTTSRARAPQAPAPAEQDPRFQGALMQLYSLLNEAWQTDDPDQYSGDSNRLLATGADLVMDLVRAETPRSEAERELYDIAAQIKAAMLVPGDTPSAERLALVEQAGEILKHLLEDPKALDAWTPPEQEEEPRIITWGTPITEGGETAVNLALRCTYDIEYLADAVVRLGATDDAETVGALARCLGLRIKRLNSRVMSLLDKDDSITMGEMQRTIYDITKPFQPVEVSPHD